MSSPSGLEFKNQYITSFGDEPLPKVTVNWNHIEGFYLNLNSDSDKEFIVKVFDKDNSLLYETTLKNNMYSKLSRKYYNGIKYEIYYESTLVLQETINFKNKRVFIVFDSSSLGDTIAWMPYCEEFRKKHNCHVIVSSFINSMFEKSYPNILFVSPGGVAHNIYAMFNIGWFYDYNKEPVLPITIPLQKSAANILGLDFTEIRPKLSFTPNKRPIDEKYVTIGMSTTAGCKEWSNPNGWQTLINYLNDIGYKVAVIQKESFSGIENVLDWTGDKPLEERMRQIYHSEFYIGLGSGLSWLAWAVNKHVVMISNFSEDGHEFTDNTTRITNPLVCNGCWNNPMFKFDKGDWYWCPEHKGTERQFECHKSITADMVINQIQHLL
jgi:autotransporter strand-loop-strand O-heptosyltransferase